jgi:histidinol dehydrogenase
VDAQNEFAKRRALFVAGSLFDIPAVIAGIPDQIRLVYKKELEKQLSSLRRRKVASESLDRRGAILIVENLDQAMVLVNRIAPEHLELAVSRPLSLIKNVKHAGAIFLRTPYP